MYLVPHFWRLWEELAGEATEFSWSPKTRLCHLHGFGSDLKKITFKFIYRAVHMLYCTPIEKCKILLYILVKLFFFLLIKFYVRLILIFNGLFKIYLLVQLCLKHQIFIDNKLLFIRCIFLPDYWTTLFSWFTIISVIHTDMLTFNFVLIGIESIADVFFWNLSWKMIWTVF